MTGTVRNPLDRSTRIDLHPGRGCAASSCATARSAAVLGVGALAHHAQLDVIVAARVRAGRLDSESDHVQRDGVVHGESAIGAIVVAGVIRAADAGRGRSAMRRSPA